MKFSDSLNEFINNYNNKHPECYNDENPHFNNVYHIQSIDEHGNVTNECFGKNIITDWGMEHVIGDFNTYDTSYYLLIGTGTGSIDRSSNNLITPFSSCRSSNSNIWIGSIGYDSIERLSQQFTPITYDSVTGASTQYISLGENNTPYIFDYNLDGITEDLTITEIGLGRNTPATVTADNNRLVTHSKIYDVYGSETTFTKKTNEMLRVYAYFGVSVNLSNLMTGLNNSHIKGVVSPSAFIHLIFNRFHPGSIFYTRKNACLFSPVHELIRYANVSTTDGTCVATYDSTYGLLSTVTNVLAKTFIENGVWVSKMVVSNLRWAETMSHIDYNYWRGTKSMILFIDQNAGFKLDPAESFTQTIMSNRLDDTFNDVTGFSFNNVDGTMPDMNGWRGRLPMSQINVSTMKSYDYTQHSWVSESYDQDSSIDYDHTMWDRFGIWYHYTYNDNTYDRYIFVNDRTQYPIIKFDTSSQIWATDTYWDPSSWESVTVSSVQTTLSKKKYYIATSTTGLNPIWDTSGESGTMNTLRLDINTESFTIPNSGINMRYGVNTWNNLVIANPNMNCIVTPTCIVYLDSSDPSDDSEIVSHTITNVGNTTVGSTRGGSLSGVDAHTLAMFKLTENGDKLVMSSFCKSSGNANDCFRSGIFRVWTIASDKSAPTYDDVDVSFTTNDPSTFTTQTFTNQGFVVVSHNDDDEVKIIDLYNSNAIISLTGQWGYALNRTTNCVYQVTTGVNNTTFAIYDMDSQSEVQRFSLDKAYTVNAVGGWKNNVYVRVYDDSLSTYRVFYYNITNESITDVTEETSDIFGNTANNFLNSQWIQCGWDHSVKSCDECWFIPVGEFDSSTVVNHYVIPRIVLDNDPTNFRRIYPTNYTYHNGSSLATYNIEEYTSGNFMSNSSGSFVTLETYLKSNANTTPCVTGPTSEYVMKLLDIGDLYDNGNVDDIYGTHSMMTTNNCANFGVIYKDWVVQYHDASNLIFIPVERFRVHKIEATTTTIQTFNDPKEFKPNNTITLSLSN